MQHARAELLPREMRDLVREPALADTGVAVEEDELRPIASARHLEHVAQRVDLVVAADERRASTGPAATRWGEHTSRAVRLDRFVAAPDGQQPERFVLDTLTRRGVGRRADDHLAGIGDGLEALCGVDDVAHHRRFAARAHRADEHLTGVDPDPHLHGNADLLGDQGQRLVHPQGGSHRPLGVVLVCDGRPEERDDLVTDDLVEPSTEGREVLDEAFEALVDEPLHLLGIGGLGIVGEADEVGHHDGDEATFLGGDDESLPALGAEPRTIGYPCPT